MSKLKIITILSKIFSNVAWGVSSLIRVLSTTGKTAADIITNTKRYDADIYRKITGKPDEQFEHKSNISYKQVLEIIKSIEVFPDLSIVVSKHNNNIVDL